MNSPPAAGDPNIKNLSLINLNKLKMEFKYNWRIPGNM
jgi:hypothetical protein